MDKSKNKEISFASYSSRVPRKQEKEVVKASDGKWKSDTKKSYSFDSGKSGKYGFIKSVK
jgi:hypothetical protein